MTDKTKHTPGPWKWQGEDYRAGWGLQMLVGPSGEGIIVGQAIGGGISPHLRSHQPVAPELCITGIIADGKEHAEPVHVFSEANARLIAAAPDMLAEIERLRDRIEQLEAQLTAMQWMPIETAPKDGTPLLLLWPDAAEKMAVMWWDEYYENWLGYYDGINPGYQPPTHWMPLPPPPEGE